jgi:hypothetical protein
MQLPEDPLAELVAGTCECEGSVCMQALQAAAPRRPSDPARELGSELPLFLVPSLEAFAERAIFSGGLRPALDAAAGFEPGNRRDQVRASEVVRGRERRAARIARPLLGHCRPPIGTADDYAPEGAWRATELSCNDCLILHAP